MALNELSAVLALRIEILSRVLPLTPIAERCKIEKTCLVVRGQLGTYHIEMLLGGILRMTHSGARQLKIPQELLDGVSVDFCAFPIDLDHRTEMILRKAYVLANDWKIDSPDLIQQLM
jgi:hypothetical protein